MFKIFVDLCLYMPPIFCERNHLKFSKLTYTLYSMYHQPSTLMYIGYTMAYKIHMCVVVIGVSDNWTLSRTQFKSHELKVKQEIIPEYWGQKSWDYPIFQILFFLFFFLPSFPRDLLGIRYCHWSCNLINASIDEIWYSIENLTKHLRSLLST